MIHVTKDNTVVNGGFFWHQPNSGIRIGSDAKNVVISNNVTMQRPKWWQLRAWLSAFRHLVALPHSDGTEQKPPADATTAMRDDPRYEAIAVPEGTRYKLKA